MHAVVERIVDSVTKLPQVQNLLFEMTPDSSSGHLHSITLDTDNVDEEILTKIKQRIAAVIHANAAGPQL